MEKELLKIIKENKEGFTVNALLQNVKFEKGYFVSIAGVNSSSCSEKAVKEILVLFDTLKDKIEPPIYIGGWTDSGIIYLDITLHIVNKKLAIAVGKVFGQIAIYNCKTGESERI